MKSNFLSISTLVLGTIIFSNCQPQNPAVIENVDTVWYMTDEYEKAIPKATELWGPVPPVVTPGEGTTPPSDAIVLFDGTDFSEWEKSVIKFGKMSEVPNYIDSIHMSGGPIGWEMGDGFMRVVPKAGYIKTKRTFQDFQLHIEWSNPADTLKEGQDRGNSGIFLQSLYEVQVLNSYQHQTYANGQAGAIYKQIPPLVNASKPPGTWQVYDIIYTAPRFGENGRLILPVRITVIHNGVLIQNNVSPIGPTIYRGVAGYMPHPLKMPIVLQDHSERVRYRNIWIREL